MIFATLYVLDSGADHEVIRRWFSSYFYSSYLCETSTEKYWIHSCVGHENNHTERWTETWARSTTGSHVENAIQCVITCWLTCLITQQNSTVVNVAHENIVKTKNQTERVAAVMTIRLNTYHTGFHSKRMQTYPLLIVIHCAERNNALTYDSGLFVLFHYVDSATLGTLLSEVRGTWWSTPCCLKRSKLSPSCSRPLRRWVLSKQQPDSPVLSLRL